MQTKNIQPKWILMLMISILLLWSCKSYHFSTPQPMGVANLYKFPVELRGSWLDTSNEGKESYIVAENHFKFITQERVSLVKGAWPKLDAVGNFIQLPNAYTGYQTIQYDSMKQIVDTVNNCIISGNLVFGIEANGALTKAYLYQQEADTLRINGADTLIVDLGQNAFLRPLNKQLYVLNIRNRVLGTNEESAQDWWTIRLIEKKADGAIVIWSPSSTMSKLPCMFYSAPSKSDIFYFICNWTSTDMLQLKKDGYFEASSALVKVPQR